MYFKILLFVSMFVSCISCFKSSINPVVVDQSVDDKQQFILNSTVEYIIVISNLTYDIEEFPPRIAVECIQCDELNPAFVVIKQKKQVTSFKLPNTFWYNKEGISYNKTEQTLCPNDQLNICLRNFNDDHVVKNVSDYDFCDINYNNVIVSLSTSSKINITVILNVSLVKNFKLNMNETTVVAVTFNAPQFYLYEFPNNTENESVLLKISSQSNSCMLVSIQNKSCPMIDTTNPYYKGHFQTITQQGAFTIMRHNFPFGFYAAFSLYPDSNCQLSELKTEKSKIVEISIHNTLPEKYYIHAIIVTMLFILSFYIVILSVSYFSFIRKDVIIPDLEVEYVTDSQEPSRSVEDARHNHKVQDVLSPTTEDTLSILTNSSLDETDIDWMIDAELDKNIYRTKTALCLSDLARKKPIILKKKSELYFWNLMTVAIFYVLPASELVTTYQYNSRESGNEDLCYYNFLCSHPWRNISDFNHFFSNVGYISFGLLFLIVTFRKDKVHNALAHRDIRLDLHYGVPQHFGLYYAMGTSLIIEGILSACYHICPNSYNFQFDASFMYIISALCMIKIYQSRHPDVNATAYSTFFVMAGVIVLGICGIFNESLAFWGLFVALHFIISFYLTMKIYYVGRWGFDVNVMRRFFSEFRFRSFSAANSFVPLYPERFFLLAIMNVCNWSLSIGALVMGVKDFASFLLVIFFVNLMLYTTFYIIMKIISNEKILLQTLLYILLSACCWSIALYYFFNKTISWKETPAESRLSNKPCKLLDFYDNHDIWHFISSIGLFFSFMVLLTLDDDLIFIHRSKIPVF